MIDLTCGDIKNSDKLAFVLFSFLKEDCFMDCEMGNAVLPKSKDITVLIPCYGKADTVERTVKSALSQTMPPFQVIVLLMDEESAAKSKDLSELDKKVKCVVSERLNVCAARNKLAELCPTEYFIFLDADDELGDNFIEETYKAEGSIVFTPCVFERSEIKDVEYDLINKDRNVFLDNSFTCLMNKTAFRDIGGFKEIFKNGVEDTDLIMRLLLQKKYKISFAVKGRFIYNECPNGLTKSQDFYESALIAINEHLKTFKELYGHNKKTFVQPIYDLLKNKDSVTKEDLHSLFNALAGREIDELQGDDVLAFTSGLLPRNVKRKQKVTFALDLKCNKACEYCGQVAERKKCGYLTEDEMFARFDKALTYCENKLGYKPIIQIHGGEPTLWSDDLFRKISERIKDYDSYNLFTNGANKNSMFWKDPKAFIEWHVTDWETIDKLEPLDRDNVIVKLVVTKKNIHLVDQFIKANKDFVVVPGFCHDAGKEFDLDLDDIKRLAEIEFENRDSIPLYRRANLNFYETYRHHGLKFTQEYCKENNIWSFYLYKNQVTTCCSSRAQSYLLEDFDGQVTKDCGNCFMFY